MTAARLEHVNVTVTDAKTTAALMCRLFDWKIRWEGEASVGGYTVHVGEDDTYLAIYMIDGSDHADVERRHQLAGLNHIGVVVDDLDAVLARVEGEGYEIYSYADYEPGRRFYFLDADQVEYEVVSYA
ncbi:MAG: VOC family protein [Pseudomonadota bacterium]